MFEDVQPQVVDYREFQGLALGLVGQLVQVTGRLNVSGYGAMTMKACYFPVDAQPGDSIECNSFHGPAILVDDTEITNTAQDVFAAQGIILMGVGCWGMEVFTYRGGGEVQSPTETWSALVGGKVERRLRMDGCGWSKGSLTMGGRYTVQGTLKQTETDPDVPDYPGMSVVEVTQIAPASDS